MPLYDFVCPKCGETTEVLQKYDDPPPQHCEGPMERVLAGGRIKLEFKGKGFYETDYKRDKTNGMRKTNYNTQTKA